MIDIIIVKQKTVSRNVHRKSFLLKNLSDVAEADHKVEETEIQFLKNISEIFGIDSPRI